MSLCVGGGCSLFGVCSVLFGICVSLLLMIGLRCALVVGCRLLSARLRFVVVSGGGIGWMCVCLRALSLLFVCCLLVVVVCCVSFDVCRCRVRLSCAMVRWCALLFIVVCCLVVCWLLFVGVRCWLVFAGCCLLRWCVLVLVYVCVFGCACADFV